MVTLGLTVGQRRRRAIELALGVSVGIAIADALVAAIGTGTWQVGVVVALAMVAAALVGGGSLLASQAGASAVLVATLQPPDGGVDFGRSLDALVGGGSALLVSSLLLPVNPLRLVRESAEPVLARLIEAIDLVAQALTTRETEAVGRGAAGARPAPTASTSSSSRRWRPPARRRACRRSAAAPWAASTAMPSPPASWAGRSRTCARSRAGPGRAINLGDAVPPEAVEAVGELAEAARALREYLDGGEPDAARAAAARAAALANQVLEATGNLSAVHIVGQIRLAAVDLMRASGLPRDEAQEAVRAGRAVSTPAAQPSSSGRAPRTWTTRVDPS